jgi:hypothetical protein
VVKATAPGQPIAQNGLDKPVEIPPLEEELEPLILTVPESGFKGAFQVEIEFRDTTGRFRTTRKLPFIGPDKRASANAR